MSNLEITLIVPIRNSETTLGDVFAGIEKQDYPIEEIWLVDNFSTDSSVELMSQYAQQSKFNVKLIRQKEDLGLSHSYNEVIDQAKTTLLITLQSDCVIKKTSGVSELVEPFEKDKQVVAACSQQITPWSVWDYYPFWQKCLFSRHAGKVLSGRNGRFCCFSVEALRKAGKFNEKAYRTAGEDGDLFLKLSKIGKVLDVEDVVVDHLHSKAARFSLRDYIYKENQLAEAVGACFSINISRINPLNYLTALTRLLMIIGLFIPGWNKLFLLLVIGYSFYVTKDVFLKNWRDPKILILPAVNIFLFFSYVYYFLRGAANRRQIL